MTLQQWCESNRIKAIAQKEPLGGFSIHLELDAKETDDLFRLEDFYVAGRIDCEKFNIGTGFSYWLLRR